MTDSVVAAFYKFADLPDFAARQAGLKTVCDEAGVLGTILLAPEGVNGTIAGSRAGIDAVIAALRAFPGCADLEWKESWADAPPFYRMKVRLKCEIVTMGVEDLNPAVNAGEYIDPQDWNAVIEDPDTVVIDTRNDYEVGIGAFDGAINPHTTSFREFPGWFEAFRRENPQGRIAMYCTGGIRCEKSTALAKAVGEENVVHLKGGILKYLETVPEDKSRWRGECFVFDQRVSVKHGLEPGDYDQCFACRRPISAADKKSLLYVEGVSCPACHGEMSAAQQERFAERQRQVELSDARGEAHFGPGAEARVAAETQTPEGTLKETREE